MYGKNIVDDKKYDINISFVRMISTLMIVSCHICQYFGHTLAWWLNCGVQVFLFMSGFLYGGKRVENGYIFLKKQIPKILIDYYCSIIFSITIYAIFAKEVLKFKNVTRMLFLSGTIEGLGQLWFVSTIVFCYILTPTLTLLIDKIICRRKFVLLILLTMIFIHVEISYIIPYYNGAWVNCYFIGLVCGKARKRIWEESTWLLKMSKICVPLAVLLNGVQIYVDYSLCYVFPDQDMQKLYKIFCNYAHVLLGISVFLVLYKISQLCLSDVKCIKKVVKFSDRYSYDIFLAHNMWLNVSPICIWGIRGGTIMIKSVVIFLLITFEVFVIRYMAEFIKNVIICSQCRSNKKDI